MKIVRNLLVGVMIATLSLGGFGTLGAASAHPNATNSLSEADTRRMLDENCSVEQQSVGASSADKRRQAVANGWITAEEAADIPDDSWYWGDMGGGTWTGGETRNVMVCDPGIGGRGADGTGTLDPDTLDTWIGGTGSVYDGSVDPGTTTLVMSGDGRYDTVTGVDPGAIDMSVWGATADKVKYRTKTVHTTSTTLEREDTAKKKVQKAKKKTKKEKAEHHAKKASHKSKKNDKKSHKVSKAHHHDDDDDDDDDD
jgi:hypothetical protein